MRLIVLGRADTCVSCGSGIAAGEQAGWDATAKTTTCTDGLPDVPLDRGEAGASVAREARRRSQRHEAAQRQRVDTDRKWRSQIKADHPVAGRIVSAMIPKARVEPEPAHVRSWAIGAPGEKKVGEVLDRIDGIVALHDRRQKGSNRNVDHIAITPAGVWVIDTKRFPDKRVEFANGGLFRNDERLLVGGRNQTRLIDGTAWQVQVVSEAASGLLGDSVVRPALCFVDATRGWLTRGPFLVRGVAICWPSALPGILARPGPFDAETIERIARRLDATLRPA